MFPKNWRKGDIDKDIKATFKDALNNVIGANDVAGPTKHGSRKGNFDITFQWKLDKTNGNCDLLVKTALP